MAEAYDGVGLALRRLGRTREAVQSHRRALELTATATSHEGGNSQYRANEAGYHMHLAEALLAAGDTREALQASRRSLEAFAALPSGMSDDINVQYSQGYAQYVHAKSLDAQGTPGARDAACAAYRASLPGLERKEARAPALPGQLGAQQVRDALKRCAQA